MSLYSQADLSRTAVVQTSQLLWEDEEMQAEEDLPGGPRSKLHASFPSCSSSCLETLLQTMLPPSHSSPLAAWQEDEVENNSPHVLLVSPRNKLLGRNQGEHK